MAKERAHAVCTRYHEVSWTVGVVDSGGSVLRHETGQ